MLKTGTYKSHECFPIASVSSMTSSEVIFQEGPLLAMYCHTVCVYVCVVVVVVVVRGVGVKVLLLKIHTA